MVDEAAVDAEQRVLVVLRSLGVERELPHGFTRMSSTRVAEFAETDLNAMTGSMLTTEPSVSQRGRSPACCRGVQTSSSQTNVSSYV